MSEADVKAQEKLEEMTDDELDQSHRDAMEEVVAVKMEELEDSDPTRWRTVEIEGDHDGSLAKKAMKVGMTTLVSGLGIETFLRTPATILEQCVFSSMYHNECPGEVISEASTDGAKELFQEMNDTAFEIMSAKESHQRGASNNSTPCTVH